MARLILLKLTKGQTEVLHHARVCVSHFTLNTLRTDQFPLILEDLAQEGSFWHIREDLLDAALPHSPNLSLTHSPFPFLGNPDPDLVLSVSPSLWYLQCKLVSFIFIFPSISLSTAPNTL